MFILNLKKIIYGCRKWDFIRVFCCYVIVYCNRLRVFYENYVYYWFRKEIYMIEYNIFIKSVIGKRFWEKVVIFI